MRTTRLLVTRALPQEVESYFSDHYDVTLNPEDRPLTPAELRAAMCEYDAICPTITDRLDAETLNIEARRVQIFANYGAGVDHIDCAAARHAGIAVTNTPDVLTDATAELAITLMLMAARRAGEGERELRSGGWTGWRPTHMIGQSLSGKSLGLVGFGRIAKATADKARAAFGMDIFYHSRKRSQDEAGAEYCPTLEALVTQCDVISLHVPGGAETHHMIDAALLEHFRPGSILVNTARGTVVDELALAQALQGGIIASAGLDVYENEPATHPELLACENAVLLPHLGSATMETRTAMGMRAAQNLDAFFASRPLLDRVA